MTITVLIISKVVLPGFKCEMTRVAAGVACVSEGCAIPVCHEEDLGQQ